MRPPSPIVILSDGAKRGVRRPPNWLLLLPVLALFSNSLRADTIRIRVVDARNGRLCAKKTLYVYDASTPRNRLPALAEGKTDKNGVIAVDLDASAIIRIWVKGFGGCNINHFQSRWQVADILSKGASQENACNSVIHATPNPGELVVFFSPETLGEILDHDFN